MQSLGSVRVPWAQSGKGDEGFSCPFFSLKTGLRLNCVNIEASGVSPGGLQMGGTRRYEAPEVLQAPKSFGVCINLK